MSDSPFGHAHKHGDCYATWYARKKAAELIGHFGFVESDEEDLAQTLLLKLLERWPQFNPNQASPGRFISWAIQKGVADLVRDKQQQNEFEPTVPVPVEPFAADEEFGDMSSCRVADPSAQASLRMDVATVLQRLPPELRQVAELLQQHSVAEIVRLTGKSRSAIRYAARQIREAFVQAGFDHPGAD